MTFYNNAWVRIPLTIIPLTDYGADLACLKAS